MPIIIPTKIGEIICAIIELSLRIFTKKIKLKIIKIIDNMTIFL